MSPPRPERVVIEFEDGMRREASFPDLPEVLGAELLRQPFASRERPDPEADQFVLVEWTDGWKEVSAVDSSCTGVHRYHVITRPEDVGRLSFQKPDGYPDLLEIIRKPLDLARVTLSESFELSAAKTIREGKKTERHFALAKDGDRLADLRADLRRVLDEEGIDPRDVLSADPEVFQGPCETLRRKMDLKAAFRQRDAVDFIRYLARTSG